MVLEFVVDENQWYKKQNDIKTLDVKYEAAWETIIRWITFCLIGLLEWYSAEAFSFYKDAQKWVKVI